jgi:hydrogenase-4 component F
MILAALLIVPLIAAPLAWFARAPRRMETINLAACAAIFFMALILAAQVLGGGSVSLWDSFLYADQISALVILLTASVALLCATYAVGYFREDARIGNLAEEDGNGASAARRLRDYYTLTPLFVFSMLLVTLANNLGVMWVAIEATTLTSVFLIGFYRRVTSLEAAWKYTMIGGVGLAMALLGTVLMYYSGYMVTGLDTLASLNWSMLVDRAGQLDKTIMRLAFILVLLGYGTKAGLAPMHTWKPDAYSEAPVPAAAMLSTASMNCAIYGLVRFYILASRCLGAEFPGGLLLLFGVLSMGLAVPFVLVQGNFRRLLAYSSIDHAGIMVTALGAGGALGALGLMLHMVFHTIAKTLLFFCAGNVYQHFQTDLFRRIKGGVIRSMPVTGTFFLMATLAVVGMPPFSLFQSEFIVLRAVFAGGHYLVIVLFILFALGIFAGALIHIANMVLGPAGEGPPARWYPWRDTSLIALAAILIVIGFWLPAPLLRLIRGAASVVTGGL